MFKLLKRHPMLRLLVSAAAGFIAYGGWAYVANMEHGELMAWRAAFTQGSYSFIITFILTGLMEWLFAELHNRSVRQRFFLSTIPVCLALYLSSWSVNYFAGTPNILLTILPGAILSSVYTFSYIAGLERLDNSI